MELDDLDFSYPSELVATEPRRPSRVLMSQPGAPVRQMTVNGLLQQIPSGDVLVINDTKVLPVRVWSLMDDEVLFVKSVDGLNWDVLFLARDYEVGDAIEFPDGVKAELSAKGLPQRLKFVRELTAKFFADHGEPALPPYIQEARGMRHARQEDFSWYQTAWAKNAGSSAAPTASLHFTEQDLDQLQNRGVKIAPLTLHVGLGTFLPIKGSLREHKMHKEDVFIPRSTIVAIHNAKNVWALGTTVTRALETYARNGLSETADGAGGETDLFIQPGFEFRIAKRLLTNFHQPKSTLLALTMAFAGEQRVRDAYKFAVENRFRLFSYGDLTAWIK